MQRDDAEPGIGCSALTWASLVLLGAGAILWAAGILLEDPNRCAGICEWVAFTLIFAGTPVSAAITVAGGSDLVLAWPVDALAWILIGVVHTKLSKERPPLGRDWNRATIAILAIALAYGGLLASAVERA